MATHSSPLAWEIQWTEEHGGLHTLTAKQKQRVHGAEKQEKDYSRQRKESGQRHGCTAAHSVTGEQRGI